MNREAMLQRIQDHRGLWDVIVVGGGATGAGVAVDAATRGYSVLLLEKGDFGCGTSSRSTKLIHGGVRYLRQAEFGLVIESLRERSLLLQNAPHLVQDLAFVLPCYRRWDVAAYGLGLKVYDLLAGRHRFGHSRVVSRHRVRELLPTIEPQLLRGGVIYHDGQFDDARLLLHLVMTAADHSAVVLNYAEVTGLVRGKTGRIQEVHVREVNSGKEFTCSARVIVNAAGPFCDEVRRLTGATITPLLVASQGSHIVLDRSFLPCESALLIPRTPDGRVLFVIPWHNHTLVGTTDLPLQAVPVEPHPTLEEIDFILETAGRYLSRKPRRQDVLSVFSGIRPLVGAGSGNTAALARDHVLHVDDSELLTITGGKWTTYRSMAESCINQAIALGSLEPRKCVTRKLRLHGWDENASRYGSLCVYGSDALEVRELADREPELAAPLHGELPYLGAEVVWSVRQEMAQTVADVLARRTRSLFLNARAAREASPTVARLMSRELGKDEQWVQEQVRKFKALAENYILR